MKAVFAVLALFVVFAVAFAAEPKDLKASEQHYLGYGFPYTGYAGYGAYGAYSAYPYSTFGGYYYR